MTTFDELPKGPWWQLVWCWFRFHSWKEWHKAWPQHRIRSCRHCHKAEIEETKWTDPRGF